MNALRRARRRRKKHRRRWFVRQRLKSAARLSNKEA